MSNPWVVFVFCWGGPVLLAFGAGFLLGRGYRFRITLDEEDVNEGE